MTITRSIRAGLLLPLCFVLIGGGGEASAQKANSIETSSAAEPLFIDDFEYQVSRDGDQASAFTAHGWSGVKSENINSKGKGYLYTVNHIPGYRGEFPGHGSKRVLAMEAKPATFGFQTDFFLQYGGQADNQIPGDVWFQFWIYINHYDDPNDKEDQLSRFGRKGKFIYPTKRGYPSNNGLWLFGTGANSAEPHRKDLGHATPSFFFHTADLQNIKFTRPSDGVTNWKIGQTNLNASLEPNQWMLVKLHFDTSTSSGKFEQWFKPMDGDWTKVAEWIDGVTTNFKWQIDKDAVGGHRSFRMPTTHNPGVRGPKYVDPNAPCDWWIYLDDFAIAESEDELPRYPRSSLK